MQDITLSSVELTHTAACRCSRCRPAKPAPRETTMNRLSLSAYAVDYGCFLAGHDRPASPPATEITDADLESVRRLVGDGRRAAIARQRGDESLASAMRETVRKLRPMVKHLPCKADELFDIGYRTVLSRQPVPYR
jgi:hypothetical protein